MLLLPLALVLGDMPTSTRMTILVAAAGSTFDSQLVSHRQEGTTGGSRARAALWQREPEVEGWTKREVGLVTAASRVIEKCVLGKLQYRMSHYARYHYTNKEYKHKKSAVIIPVQ